MSFAPLRREAVVIPYTNEQCEVALTDQVEHAVELGEKDLVVDLGNVQMVSAALLATLHRAGAKLRGYGGQLTVVCGHPALARLLRLTLLSRAFAVVSTRDEALRERT